MKGAPYKIRILLGFFLGAVFGVGLAFGVTFPTTVGGVALFAIASGACFAILALIAPRVFRGVASFLKHVSW